MHVANYNYFFASPTNKKKILGSIIGTDRYRILQVLCRRMCTYLMFSILFIHWEKYLRIV